MDNSRPKYKKLICFLGEYKIFFVGGGIFPIWMPRINTDSGIMSESERARTTRNVTRERDNRIEAREDCACANIKSREQRCADVEMFRPRLSGPYSQDWQNEEVDRSSAPPLPSVPLPPLSSPPLRGRPLKSS